MSIGRIASFRTSFRMRSPITARLGSAALLVGLATSGFAIPNPPPSDDSRGKGGLGGPVDPEAWFRPVACGDGGCNCIPPEERARVEAEVAANRERLGLADGGVASSTPRPYPFFPMAGHLDEDRIHVNFVDLNTGSGILDYRCSALSYNGHQGIDTDIRQLAHQEMGVPVFAALDGTVVYTRDGEPDDNLCVCGAAIPGWPQCPPGTEGNAVIIDHGGGHQSWYWHLRTGSVSVSVGQAVVAGQPIGMVASSGCSTGPHLHFESRLGGVRYEPFAGNCNAVPSGWVDQEPFDIGLKVRGFATSRTSPGAAPSQFELPISVQKALSDPWIFVWVQLGNLPANSTWQFRFFRPNGTTAFTSAVGQLSSGFFRTGWAWWQWNIADMQQITGTWTVQLDINGVVAVTAPFVVVNTIDPNFNRAPNPVGITLSPSNPTDADALIARVNGPFPIADPDFNHVAHRWVWRVNGQVVRDVTTGARSDILARGLGQPGASISCTVTPTDGLLQAPPVSASVTVVTRCPADLDGNSAVNSADLAILLGAWGQPGASDLDGNGSTGASDLSTLLGAWGNCP
jgi:murein DD-endopeptidase MepM/ murein hydrolase activator NlpD